MVGECGAIHLFDDAAWMPARPSCGGRISVGMTVKGLGHAAELLDVVISSDGPHRAR
jgi:hypothetical protein